MPADESLEFQCPKCGKKLKAGQSMAGKRVKCPKCTNPFVVPGIAPQETPSRNVVDTDWLSLETPAITDIEARKREAAEKQSELDAAKAARQHRLKPSVEPPNAQPPLGNSATADEHADRDFTLAPLDGPSKGIAPPKSEPANASRKPSIFDDDLPQLAELSAAPPPPRPKPLLDLELDDFDDQATPRRSSSPSSSSSNRATNRTSNSSASNSSNAGERRSATSRAAGRVAPAAAEMPQEYRVVCSVCGTPQYVPLSAQGMKVKCPDCFSSFRAGAYVPKAAGPKLESTGAEVYLAPPEENRELAEQDSRRNRTNALLERAEKELTDDEVESLYGSDFDTAGFIQRTFGFLFDPVAVAFVLGYGVVFAIVFALFQYGMLNQDAGYGRGALLLAMIGAPLVGILFGMPMLSSALALLESVANRQTRVQEWPGFNVFDHFGDLLAMAAAIFIAAIPGALLGFIFNGEEEGAYRMRLAAAMLSTYFLFPIILLSILDNGSLMQPISEAVLRSIKSGAESWGAYYLKTLFAYGGAVIIWFICLGPEKPPLVWAIGGFLLSPLVFFTSQQLGALADAISEHLSFEFTPASEKAAESKDDQASGDE